MSKSASQFRDIIIGLILIVIGGATLLHTLNIFVFDEEQVIMIAIYGMLAIAGLLILTYLFSRTNVWLLILALCVLFIAAITYVLNFRPHQEELIGVSLFLITSLAFFTVFIVRPSQWWAMLTGWISLGLAGTVYTSMTRITIPYLERIPQGSLPPLVLFAGISLGFIFVWLTGVREKWWALMTAGQILAVFGVILVQALDYNDATIPTVLFLVSGISFLLVWMLSSEKHNLSWAIYPALVLISFSAFLYLITFWVQNSRMVLSIIFLIIGFLFLINYFRTTFQARKQIMRPSEPYSPPVSSTPASQQWTSTPAETMTAVAADDSMATTEEEKSELFTIDSDETVDKILEETEDSGEALVVDEEEEDEQPADYPEEIIDDHEEEQKKE